DCFSAWDLNKRAKMEGRRYPLEIKAGNTALDLMETAFKSEFNRKRKSKKKAYYPKIVYLMGNHEDRVRRYLEYNPELQGAFSIEEDLNNRLLLSVKKEIELYLKGKLKVFTVPINLGFFNSNPFKLNVWKKISEIKYGKTITYKAIAESLNSDGFQAVGNACGDNPIPIIVPCHRVIGSDGDLHGFGGGIEMKKFLLNLERPHKPLSLQNFF
ncbi:MAG: methylated-DNA--[protein]-cysteine S-methyltransferase, partial [Candidatus Thorarchaeota archaeon]